MRTGVDVSWSCKKCKGEKTITEKKRHEIFIEKGMTNGQRIIIAGAGDEEVCVTKISLQQHLTDFSRVFPPETLHLSSTQLHMSHLSGRGATSLHTSQSHFPKHSLGFRGY